MTIDPAPITYILDWLSGKLLNADPHGEQREEWVKITDARAALDALVARIKELEDQVERLELSSDAAALEHEQRDVLTARIKALESSLAEIVDTIREAGLEDDELTALARAKALLAS